MPTVVTMTLAAGFQLARLSGFLDTSSPRHTWIVVSFCVVGVMAVIALAYLEPANVAVLFELRKPQPDGRVIEKLMRRFVYTAGITGVMQVATLVVLAAPGWLYVIQPRHAVPGPQLPTALPLDELSRHSAVPLAWYFAVWAAAALVLAAYARWARIDRLTGAIAAFEETLVTPNARFDQWLKGDDRAISKQELAGYQLFKSAGCIACHTGPAVGGTMFQKMGLVAPYATRNPSIGRADVTGKAEDRHVFKVPTLRNIALTGPYFHNGVFQTLDQVVAWYVTRDTDPGRWYVKADGTPDVPYNDLPVAFDGNVNVAEVPYNPAAAPSLTNQEMSDVVHFLCTLTDGFDPANPSAYNVPAQCQSTAASVGAARIQSVSVSGATGAKTSTSK